MKKKIALMGLCAVMLLNGNCFATDFGPKPIPNRVVVVNEKVKIERNEMLKDLVLKQDVR